jgi:subtilisin family serine protease
MSWLTWAQLEAATGAGVRVAVIDSGVDTTHPALTGVVNARWTVELEWEQFPTVKASELGDAFGHGTAVAWIVRQMAPQAIIDSIRVLDGALRSSTPKVAHAMQWAVRQGFDVINCSFGASSERYLQSYKASVDAAFCSRSILVAACNNRDYRTPEYPGAFPTVVSTDFGAFDGLRFARRQGALVEFVSRGVDLQVPWKGGATRTVSGSSFAAPHLAGLVARIKQLRPEWNAVQVKAQLYALANQ